MEIISQKSKNVFSLLLALYHRRKLPVMCRVGLSTIPPRGISKDCFLGLKVHFSLCIEFKASLKLQAELKAIVISPHFYTEPIEV